MNIFSFAAFAMVGLVVSAQSLAAPNVAGDTRDVDRVMQAFHEAVAGHDGDKLEALFLPKANLFNVLDDGRLATAKAKSPAAAKVRVNSAHEFAQFVTMTKQSLDPVHSNVRVMSDGVVATVYFDFVFNMGGKAENAGNETWQLVKDEKGWKIASIAFSSRVAKG
jgi:hypothetical protein